MEGRGRQGWAHHLGCSVARHQGRSHPEPAVRARLGPARRDCPGTGGFQVQTPWPSVGGAPILGSAGKAARGGAGKMEAWRRLDEPVGECWASGGRSSRNPAGGEPRWGGAGEKGGISQRDPQAGQAAAARGADGRGHPGQCTHAPPPPPSPWPPFST